MHRNEKVKNKTTFRLGVSKKTTVGREILEILGKMLSYVDQLSKEKVNE